MTQSAEATRMLDEYQVTRVRRIWAFSRDHGDWETLKSCFHPDATVIISWYSGSASGFVERSQQAAATRKPEERSQHWLGNARADVRGNRAILESDVQILSRDYLDGHLFDCTCYGRFYDLFERRNGEWRIAKWTCIYDKDRLDPVLPTAVPPSFYDELSLTGENSSCAFMRLRQKKKGRSVPAGLTMGGSEAERSLKAEGAQWLARAGSA
jgi:SnoaL-like domain